MEQIMNPINMSTGLHGSVADYARKHIGYNIESQLANSCWSIISDSLLWGAWNPIERSVTIMMENKLSN
jgi:hypothetical protein